MQARACFVWAVGVPAEQCGGDAGARVFCVGGGGGGARASICAHICAFVQAPPPAQPSPHPLCARPQMRSGDVGAALSLTQQALAAAAADGGLGGLGPTAQVRL